MKRWFRRMMRKLVYWLAPRVGVQAVNRDEYRNAVTESMKLIDYIDRSGSLDHPNRLKAKRRIQRGAMQIVAQLAIGEHDSENEKVKALLRGDREDLEAQIRDSLSPIPRAIPA